ncbi:hypothetical protein JZ751_025427, partial [Albula glossodonta]
MSENLHLEVNDSLPYNPHHHLPTMHHWSEIPGERHHNLHAFRPYTQKDFESHQQFFHYPPAEFHEIPIKPPLTKMQGVSPPPALPKFPLSMAPHELNPGRETPHAAHLSATHVGSKKRQCGSCETVASDIAHWTLLEPSTYGENGILSYSFICPPGRYECQESGLRWVCVVGVSLQYHY